LNETAWGKDLILKPPAFESRNLRNKDHPWRRLPELGLSIWTARPWRCAMTRQIFRRRLAALNERSMVVMALEVLRNFVANRYLCLFTKENFPLTRKIKYQWLPFEA
jgi:hypothetical protein